MIMYKVYGKRTLCWIMALVTFCGVYAIGSDEPVKKPLDSRELLSAIANDPVLFDAQEQATGWWLLAYAAADKSGNIELRDSLKGPMQQSFAIWDALSALRSEPVDDVDEGVDALEGGQQKVTLSLKSTSMGIVVMLNSTTCEKANTDALLETAIEKLAKAAAKKLKLKKAKKAILNVALSMIGNEIVELLEKNPKYAKAGALEAQIEELNDEGEKGVKIDKSKLITWKNVFGVPNPLSVKWSKTPPTLAAQ
jgi:hypothetical protein